MTTPPEVTNESIAQKKLSAAEWRAKRDLEEARKQGTAAPEIDEEGNAINPHIPQYISAAPWYLGQQGPGLKHQRAQDDKVRAKSSFGEWYDRGAKVTVQRSSGFRKGACTNCGAMGHAAKDCLERPRKVGAWKTGDVVAVEDVAAPELALDYAAKHDRWNGYEPAEFKTVVERYQRMEEIRQKAKAEAEIKRLLAAENPDDPEAAAAAAEAAAAAAAADADADDDDEGFKEADGFNNAPISDKPDPRTKTTVRNLRTREDTAKYLRNLDVSSAYFDPKTRSMRENPTPNVDPALAVYAGDNFVRHTGEAQDFAAVQRFAWEAASANKSDAAASTLVLAANPSQVELLHRQFKEKKATLLQRRREAILDKYGGAEHLDDNQAHEAQLAATERYVEYDAQGRVIKGLEKGKVKSKYEEDVYPGNHTTVWGSYWNAGRWGFKCCHSYVKSSYCLGEAGVRAAASELLIEPAPADAATAAEPLSLMAQLNAMTPDERDKLDKQRRKRAEKEEKERKRRYKEALKEEKELARKRLVGDIADDDTKPRAGYGDQSGTNAEVTKEQYEAYLLNRHHTDDPMARFLAEEQRNEPPAKKKRSSKKSESSSSSSSSESSRRRHKKKSSKKSKRK